MYGCATPISFNLGYTILTLICISQIRASPVESSNPLRFCVQTALSTLDCMSVDVCLQRNDRGEDISQQVWHHRNETSMLLTSEGGSASAGQPLNMHNIELLRVPRGVILKVCAPDFAILRETGVFTCNEDTIDTIIGECADTSWNTTCEDTRTNSEDHVQMLWYQLASTWGCHEQSEVEPGYYLSSTMKPNYFADCPVLDLERATFTDSCEFTCLGDFLKIDGECQSQCASLPTQCGQHQYASEQCVFNQGPRYNCSECLRQPGFYIPPFATRPHKTDAECQQTECAAGSYGSQGECLPCPMDTYSDTPGSARCEECAWGKHQPASGATVCLTCFDPETAPPECEAGTQAYGSLTGIEGYFASVNGSHEFADSPLGVDVLRGFCRAGHACLPCPPGSREEAGTCTGCPLGTYQPHFKARVCFECSHGQTTVEKNATSSTDCVCVPGFE